jgi:hypothetical protein
MLSAINESNLLCPLCGSGNGCGAVAEGEGTFSCWCKDYDFNSNKLKTILAEVQHKSCICKSCVTRLEPLESTKKDHKPQPI